MNPPPIFIGFRVKQVHQADEWRESTKGAQNVVEICSISECNSKFPPDWEKRWDFNVACCYNSEPQALVTIPCGQEEAYELFAYRMFPLEFGKSNPPRTLDISKDWIDWQMPLRPEPNLNEYILIGYDVAGGPGKDLEDGRILMTGFSCSPLSCNGMAEEFQVNRFCLIDDLEEAIRAAENFGQTEPETGPFYLYEVLRKRSDKWQP